MVLRPGAISGLASILYNAVLPYNPQLANYLAERRHHGIFLNIPLSYGVFQAE
jgi:hypothetical protein